MKKTFLLVLLVSILTIVLMGCQAKESNQSTESNELLEVHTAKKSNRPEASEVNLTKVSISNSSGFGRVNPKFFTVYEDEEVLNLFDNAISKAVRLGGIVDMIEPEYDLEIIYSDGSKDSYHLWLGEKGTLMDVNDTHTIYSVSEEITTQLVDLIK